MTARLAAWAPLLQLLYALSLLGIGGVGIWTARWELGAVYGLDPSAWTAPAQATFLNQYRFLKGVEFSAGLFCLLLRQQILGGRQGALAFSLLVATGVCARTIAWVADGRPAPLFIAFLALELIVLISFFFHMRRADAPVD